jgi:hypothetical protein
VAPEGRCGDRGQSWTVTGDASIENLMYGKILRYPFEKSKLNDVAVRLSVNIKVYREMCFGQTPFVDPHQALC